MIFGVLSTLSLRQELLPSTQVPTAILTATYPGTSPELVADEVATPLEQAISGVSGVTKVRSVSTNGLASLTVEWTYGLDNDEVRGRHPQRRRRGGRHHCPTRWSTRCWPAAPTTSRSWCSASPPTPRSEELARQVDDTVVPQLSGIEGVRQVQVSGQDVTELVVTLRPAELRKYDLSAAAVTQAVQAQAQVVPAGNSYDEDIELAIQVGRTTTAAKQVAGWWIPAPDGPVRLGTLADGRGAVGGGDHDRPVRRPAGPQREHPEGDRRRRGRDLPPDHRAAARHRRRAWARTPPSRSSSTRRRRSSSRSRTWPSRAASAWPSRC